MCVKNVKMRFVGNEFEYRRNVGTCIEWKTKFRPKQKKKQTKRFVFFMNSVLLFAHWILCETILKSVFCFFFRRRNSFACPENVCIPLAINDMFVYQTNRFFALVLCHKNASALQFIKLIDIYCTFVQHKMPFISVV